MSASASASAATTSGNKNTITAATALGDWSSSLLRQLPQTATAVDSSSAIGTMKSVNGNSDTDDGSPIQLEAKDRIISLIHIGKAGGVSLRRLTVIHCKLFFRHKRWDGTRQENIQKCIEKHFPDPQAVLSHQTQYYFHIEEYNTTQLEQSTSFLMTLRNPVDRIISTYRYSHPGNCNGGNRDEVWKPRGCQAAVHRNKTGLIQNEIFYKCFPSPAMEDFAQSLLKPWKRNQNKDWGDSLSMDERRNCRYLAREMVQGYGTYGSGPHMLYNYAYYAHHSVWQYPDKEVFGIRTEHEWEDTVELDRLLGGNGNLKENREVSHGSESLLSSPLSTEAYQKICCALETEIEVYQDILQRVVNLNARAKRESMETIKTKCGVVTTWTEWRVECRRQLRSDLRALHPALVVNETKYDNFKVGLNHALVGKLFGRKRHKLKG